MAPKKPATAASSAPAARTTVESTSKVTKKRLPKKTSARPGERVFKDGAESQLEYDDNDSLEDIISEIGKRSLTNVDKELIEAITFLGDDDDEVDRVDWERVQRDLDQREIADYVAGKPFNCHFKLYYRFIFLKADRLNRANVARRSKGPSRSQSIEPPAQLSPRGSKSSTGSVARSPSKPASPKKPASPNRIASPNKAGSPGKPRSPNEAASSRPASNMLARRSVPIRQRPTKDTAPGKQLAPVKASAGGRAASRSPTHKTARSGSTSSNKRQPQITRPIPRESMKRARESSQDAGEFFEEEGIDEVDYNGIVLDQRLSSGRKDQGKGRRIITRPTPSPAPNKSPVRQDNAGDSVAVPKRPKAKKTAVEKPLEEGQPSKKGHGSVRSPLNPEYLTQDGKSKKKNAFFETMPLAEEWHRNMPSFLSIGETPYMETVVSNQIEDDLGRTHEEVQEKPPQKKPSLTGILDAASNWWNGNSSKAKEPVSPSKKDEVAREEHLIATMWDLPGLNGEAPLSNQKVSSPARSRSQGSGRGSRG
ncbi:hypothetical protein PRZ48_001799 [Zasmidium cellare]|uniref:Uncharacterized protein n=1 Tax=Zasmidium cellare TaxID=395010 RepID=A0ABR0F293_ZASCE|nr:hypothetical protein PRZ48_001799 [Zasmidium cellare]